MDSRQNQLMRNKSYEISHNRDLDLKNIFLHSHDFYELYFFISGQAEYSVEDLHYNLVSGDIIMISPNHLHQLEVLNEKITYERIVLWLNPKYLKNLSTKETDLTKCFELCVKNKTFLVRDFHLSEKIRSLLLNVEELENSTEFGRDIEKELLIRQLLLQVNKFFHSENFDQKAINARYAKHSSQIISKTMKYIEENLSQDLNLEKICSQVYVSKYYLSHLFKAETNTSIHQFITKKRLLFSKKLIEEGKSIKEIYLQCGFQDESNFFRSFKNEFNMTPNQYRKLLFNE